MGIYTDGNVYGVFAYTNQDDGKPVVLFKKQYATKMTYEQIQAVKTCYDKLSIVELSMLRIQFFTYYSYSYNTSCLNPVEKDWYPGNTDMLQELFMTGDIRLT